jgi:hypothetical protein
MELHSGKAVLVARVIRRNVECEGDRHRHIASIDELVGTHGAGYAGLIREEVEAPIGVAVRGNAAKRPVVQRRVLIDR